MKEYLDANPTTANLSWDEFERHLIVAGWNADEARRERLAQEHGDLGDCDGDLEP